MHTYTHVYILYITLILLSVLFYTSSTSFGRLRLFLFDTTISHFSFLFCCFFSCIDVSFLNFAFWLERTTETKTFFPRLSSPLPGWKLNRHLLLRLGVLSGPAEPRLPRLPGDGIPHLPAVLLLPGALPHTHLLHHVSIPSGMVPHWLYPHPSVTMWGAGPVSLYNYFNISTLFFQINNIVRR
jgi:hypothetical protein